MLSWMDLRYAFRLMRRSPVFTLLTVVVLSGGLGVSIFTFSFLYTAMLKPLPLAGGDRIVRLEEVTRGSGGTLDVADVKAMRASGSLTSLAAIGGYQERTFVVGDARHQRVLSATAAEANLFDVAATRPMLGRALTSADADAGAEAVIVLSEWAWRVVFGSDSTLLDRRIALNGKPTRVVGVMPKGFGFPVASESWVPLGREVLERPAGVERVDVYAKLAPGASVARAGAEAQQFLERTRAQRIASGVPAESVEKPIVSIRSFPMAQIGDEGPMVFAVLNLLAVLILSLACINVMNLLLARANERVRETAVRLALGASRARLVMQSLWESIVLCVAGGLLATAIAAWGLDAVDAWLRVHLERNLVFWWSWHIDRAAIVAAGAFVTLVIAILGGVVSARVTSVQFTAVLRDGGARAGDRREGRLARFLVVAQVATVSVLMFFGVMSSVVAYRVSHVEVGYDTRKLLSANVGLPSDRYPSREGRARLAERLYGGMASRGAIAGVLLRSQVASITDEPGGFALGSGDLSVSASRSRAYVTAVLGAMELAGARLSTGRVFDARDDDGGAPVAIVSRTLAERSWPGRNALGQQLRLADPSDSARVRTVVGVVDDVLMGNPFSRDRSAMAVYLPLAQTSVEGVTVLFRHRGDAAAAQAALYDALGQADPQLVAPEVATYAEILEKTTLIANSVTSLFSLCFGFALLLAVSGTYALMARSIGQRTREIGIRRALGASDERVVRLLLGQGGRQLGVGAAIALPVMLAIAFEFWRYFPIPLAASVVSAVLVSAAIVSVVLAATYLPTRRALRVSPRDALVTE